MNLDLFTDDEALQIIKDELTDIERDSAVAFFDLIYLRKLKFGTRGYIDRATGESVNSLDLERIAVGAGASINAKLAEIEPTKYPWVVLPRTVSPQVLVRIGETVRKLLAKKVAARVLERVKYQPASQSAGAEELRKLLYSMIWREPTELEVAVLRHFIWQVKRKLAGKSINNMAIMPVIFGRQGVGKSLGVEKLIEPLREVTQYTEFGTFTDDRNARSLEQYYITVMDEMSNLSKTDSDALKRLIGGTSSTFRQMYTNDTASIAINTTLIGTSNKPLSELLRDTESRRFFEIRHKHLTSFDMRDVSLDQAFHDLRKQCNPLAIWQSVDEGAEESSPGFLQAIANYHNEQSREVTENNDPLVAYLTHIDASKSEDKDDYIRIADFYQDFRQYAEDCGYTTIPHLRTVSNRLRDIGFARHRTEAARGYLIKTEGKSKSNNILTLKGIRNEQD